MKRIAFIISALAFAIFAGLIFSFLIPSRHIETTAGAAEPPLILSPEQQPAPILPPRPPAHVPMPSQVKAIYSTMYTAANQTKRDALLDLIGRTELNAMVIDVKGSQGELAFNMFDVPKVISELHSKGVWAIARIVVFQDSSAAERTPSAVIKSKNGGVWRDPKGYAYLDPADKDGWQYVIDVSKRAIDAGFDEINYDYIRFPSDGRLDLMVYPAWQEGTPKSDAIRGFLETAKQQLKAYAPDTVLSIDVFAYTFLVSDDLGIGQQLDKLIDVPDYIYPMAYPSHYTPGNFGYDNPANHPYEVVIETLRKGMERFGDKANLYEKKIRPWLQAFDLGAAYTPDKIRAEIQATADAYAGGSKGWLLWDPNNVYKRGGEYLSL